jgi:histidine triad (HIT) family protein
VTHPESQRRLNPAPLGEAKTPASGAAAEPAVPAVPAGAGAIQYAAMREPQATTVFDRILAGEIPCYRIYEDEHVLAFLDIGPLSHGHTLLIPKERRAHLHELSDDSAAALGRALPRLCRAVMRASGASAYNVLQNNGTRAHQVVMHVHFHIIPKTSAGGLGIGWQAGSLDEAAARQVVEEMRRALAEEGV